MKKALITGITGQDGAYLAEFLLEKGYEVHGIKRRSSLFNTDRIDHIYQDPHDKDPKFILHHGDLTDSSSLIRIIQESQPDEIYNLAAQSHVAVSFEEPEYTANSDALGSLRILEAIRILGLEKKTKYYQASSSELFGKVQEIPQNEKTPFHPRSPYAVAKLYAYWITINYREAYSIYACNGILFNHESPRRPADYVTRKISQSVARISVGKQGELVLGDTSAKIDWGFSGDYVEAEWLALQQDEADDYVIATGEAHSVQEFVDEALIILQDENKPFLAIGNLLHESWKLKRELSNTISNPQIDQIYEEGIEAGALGGKILGAGGGGFIIFFAAPEHHANIRNKLKNLTHVPFRFDNMGSKIVVCEPNGFR